MRKNFKLSLSPNSSQPRWPPFQRQLLCPGPVPTKPQLLQHPALLVIDGRSGDHEERTRFLTSPALPLCNLLPQAALAYLRRTAPHLALEPALEGNTQHGLAKLTLCTRHTHCSTGQRSCATAARARPDGASFLVHLPCVPSSPPGSPSGSPPPAAEETGHLHTAPEEEDLDAEVKLEPPETEEHLVTPMPNKKLSESTAGAENNPSEKKTKQHEHRGDHEVSSSSASAQAEKKQRSLHTQVHA